VDEDGNTLNPADGNTNDVSSSMGVFFTEFQAVDADNSADTGVENIFNRFALDSSPVEIRDKGVPLADPLGFLVNAPDGAFGGKTNVRRVEPRNTPTNINAVFNFHNFWDGRGNHFFNGVNPLHSREERRNRHQKYQHGERLSCFSGRGSAPEPHGDVLWRPHLAGRGQEDGRPLPPGISDRPS
jgi:hypothetical protein